MHQVLNAVQEIPTLNDATKRNEKLRKLKIFFITMDFMHRFIENGPILQDVANWICFTVFGVQCLVSSVYREYTIKRY